MDILLTIINILFIPVALFIYKKSKSVAANGNNLEDIKLLPAEINYLVHNVQYMSRAILATLLDLDRRGNIRLAPYKRESRNKRIADYVVEYEITLLNKDGLDPIEDKLIELTFRDQDKVTTDQLTQEHIEVGQSYFSRWGQWVDLIKESLINKGLLNSTMSSKDRTNIKIGFLMAAISIYTVFNRNMVGLVGLLPTMVVLLIGINGSMSMTSTGDAIYKELIKTRDKLDKNSYPHVDSVDKMLELISLALPVNKYIDIYDDNDPTIELLLDNLNSQGGSTLDDGVMRAFLGFRKPTTSENLDTNRPSVGIKL